MTILDTINEAISLVEQQHEDAQRGPWKIEAAKFSPPEESVLVEDDRGRNVLVGSPSAAALILTLYATVDFLLATLYAARDQAEPMEIIGGDDAVQHRRERSKTLDAGYRLANVILGRDS